MKRKAHNAARLEGQRFGRLAVVRRHERNSLSGKAQWRCLCTCGGVAIATTGDLRSGATVSCGCFRKEQVGLSVHGHGRRGKHRSPTYHSWADMVKRCTNPRNWAWKYYGERGITVCERWMTFENFLADMGDRPEGLTLDRINNDGNYEPGNCRWATRKQQSENRRKPGTASVSV